MSAATIAEPFLLASYPDSQAHRKHSSVPLYASLPSTSDADPFVTVAVHGDGVHVLDTSTLHPAVSHTLGPSTSFAGPPASRTSHSGGSRVCTTYTVLQTGPDVQPDGKGKTVVAWEESLSGGVSADSQGEKNKRVAVAPHPVLHIYAPEYLPNAAVLIGPAGEVSITDEELLVQHTFTPQNQQASTLLKHFLFPSSTTSFLSPQAASSHRAVLLLVLRSGGVLRVAVVGISEDRSLNSLGESALPVEETDIVDVSCSNTGFISVLSHTGTWHALSLSTSPTSALSISPAAEPLRLQALTFTSPNRAGEASLSALTSSHVLLAAVSSGSPAEIVLLLWDLRYGVLIAQQAIPVPSTLPRPKKTGAIIRLSTPPVSPEATTTAASSVILNGLLVLAPAPDRDPQAESTPARSTLLVVPITVPAASTIAAAMGRASAGARWLSTKSVPNAAGQVRGAPEMSPAARKALKEMRASINGSAAGNVEGAEAAFFEYFKPDNSRKAVSAAKADAAEGRVAPVEHAFTQGVLDLVLPAAGAQTSGPVAYSAKIVRYLLERRAVSSSMVAGGLLPALAARDDWETINLAMRTVTDLPETDLVLLLSKVVAEHRKNSLADDDSAMQVDPAPASSTPTLTAFLAQCVVYPFTPALQRVAVRKHLPDAADLVPVLQVLDGWIVQHTDDGALLAAGSPTVSPELPPLDKILAFLQPLLDASFLALLAYAPAHRLLRTLAAHIEPALALTSALEHLCGPLEPFARAAAKAQSKDAAPAAKADSGRDWRRKRKAAQEQAQVAIGLYQVEELVL